MNVFSWRRFERGGPFAATYVSECAGGVEQDCLALIFLGSNFCGRMNVIHFRLALLAYSVVHTILVIVLSNPK